MIVAVDNSARCRIRSISAKPFIFGMCMSVKINPNGSPACRAAESCASASSPSSTDTDFISHRPSIPSRIRRLVRLSSTNRTFTPRKASGGAIVPNRISFASVTPTPRREVKLATLPNFALHPDFPTHHFAPAVWKSSAPVPCRRTFAWSKCLPAKMARRSARAFPAEFRCRCPTP